jgi:hypothetical protein
MALSHDEALLLAFRAELDQTLRTTIPHEEPTQSDEEKK